MARIATLDINRGIAVLGLLFLNIYYFSMFEVGYVNLPVVPLSDSVIDWINALLLDGRFRSLFCLLFGAALCLQMDKNGSDKQIKDRLFWIVTIGLLHGYILWPGDILVSYGLAGFIALKYIGAGPSRLIRHGCGFGLFGVSMMLVLGSIDVADPIIRGSSEFYEIVDNLPRDVVSHFGHNGVYYSIMLLIMPLITLWYSAGLMIAGIYCYKQGIFKHGLSNNAKPLVITATALLSVGTIYLKVLDINSLSVLVDSLIWVNAFAGALLIIHCVVKMSRKGFQFSWLQAVGRMALTLYVFQSVLMVSFFYWVMPNGYEQYNRMEYMAIALLLSLFQLLIAPLYFRFFKQGPLEYLLKRLCLRSKEADYV
ncbi:DUF418 domain-containing protein [Pseudoalteromonas sp. MMG012]|uniref:DUF418 domain-containing protein n=1 Tax=Pseudoalteromonas sp. MMG012 TaxID=2822686 RepID=UPI001B3A6072|nr:DUF418 domain-containing protein [Pseudoalteromonas sp. MMG012]MBQ4849691.1 DUF418 domain-containing protein [Pseudoalteromonas sp. MMG012]